jgi:hypothetical protein
MLSVGRLDGGVEVLPSPESAVRSPQSEIQNR